MNEIQLEKDIIILSTRTIQKLFTYENGSDVVALYLFYHNQCKLQGADNNLIVCVGDFVKKSLGWGDDRFRNTKRILRDIGLIEDMKVTGRDGKITGSAIKVNSIN